jgi:hypothetical protein
VYDYFLYNEKLVIFCLQGGYSRDKLDFLMAIGEGLLNISGSTGI